MVRAFELVRLIVTGFGIVQPLIDSLIQSMSLSVTKLI